MAHNPETPNRDIQRELVFQNIKNPGARELLRRQIPSDQIKAAFGTDYEGEKNFGYILTSENGETFSHVLGIASVAQNSNQLANAFKSLEVLSGLKYSRDSDVVSKVDQAQNAFLGKRFNVIGTSEGARELEAKFLAAWTKAKGDVRYAADVIKTDLRPFNNDERKRADRFSAEAIFLTLLDSQVPLEFRKAILQNFGTFTFGNFSASGIDEKFKSDASFWRSVDASWVMPELFGRQGFEGDSKDKEIAMLRSKLRNFEESGFRRQPEVGPQEVVNLKSQLEAAHRQNKDLSQQNYRLNQSNADLKAENERLRNSSNTAAAKPSPFMRLSIDRSEWDRADLAGKRKILDDAYRPLLHKYHPDKHPSVRMDPVVKELVDANMADINKAVNDLEIIYKIPKKV